MNRLVPYLDLFGRLDDAELARLASVDTTTVGELRKQVDEIGRALAPYVDLADRLSEEEFVRLTRASVKTIRFWKLCQPRKPGDDPSASSSTNMMRAHVSTGSSPSAESSTTMERQAVVRASGMSSRPSPPPPKPKPAGPPGLGIPDDDDEDDFSLTFQE